VRTLSLDDVELGRLATEHLLALGHTEIAHIGGDALEMDFHLPTNRRHGYELAMRDAGLETLDRYFHAADFTMEGGYRAAKQLLGNPAGRPPAIFAASDEMAIGAILAAKDLGMHVPGDVSIMGIDDHELAEFFGLTTIAQFPDMQGRMAVEVLMDELHPGHREAEELNIDLPYELVVRSSTARR